MTWGRYRWAWVEPAQAPAVKLNGCYVIPQHVEVPGYNATKKGMMEKGTSVGSGAITFRIGTVPEDFKSKFTVKNLKILLSFI